MVTPKELSEMIGVDPKLIRKFARNNLIKRNGEWNFTEDDIRKIKGHFGNSNTTLKDLHNPDPTTQLMEELRAFAQDFVKSNYGVDLIIPIEINPKLTRALGRFIHKRTTEPGLKIPVKIDLAKDLITYYKKEEIIDVLKHELIHYSLYMLDKPYRDRHPYFENELKKHQSHSTDTMVRKGPSHQYHCTGCGKELYTPKKLKDPNKYHSKCCKTKIKYSGKVFLT